jgi:arginine-tRNA-protein transferase
MSAELSQKFPPAFYRRYLVGGLSPTDIDEMLGNGWFRNDMMVCSMSIKPWQGGWCSSLMLRIPLRGFTWKKRLRKVLRRNRELFSVQIQPFVTSAAKEKLWQKFKTKVHGWGFVPPLAKHLFKEKTATDFQTWEVNVFYRGSLVAFSVFDRGATSLASLEAAYDPDFSRYSLGMYTMLMEIEFASTEGMAFYYPGFIPKGESMFEYKLRPGNVQFFRLREQQWVSWENLQADDWQLETVMRRLGDVSQALKLANVLSFPSYGLFIHEPYEALSPVHFNIQLAVLDPGNPAGTDQRLVAWDPVAQCYLVFRASLLHNLPFARYIERQQWLFLLDIRSFELVDKTSDALEAAALTMDVGKNQGPGKWFFPK